jgi:polyisoprenyl-phosphate glycosyltransferase
MPEISIVIPAFNELSNLELLYSRINEVMTPVTPDWELIIVDDNSKDGTFGGIMKLSERDPRVRGIRFARNYGSHTAITCGLHHALGDCAVVLAADLQDPPETIPRMMELWRNGAHVVWAARRERLGETKKTVMLARVYYWLMRKVADMDETPENGADFFLADRRVVEAFRQFNESNTSIMALVMWMGFRQERIYYDKQARASGESGWSFEMKMKLAIDSITSFTYKPIRMMTYFGMIVALLGFLYAGVVIVYALAGNAPSGWTSLMVVLLVLGGIQMLMMGVLGEYLWRAFDESRNRPRYLIEATTGFDPLPPGAQRAPRPMSAFEYQR